MSIRLRLFLLNALQMMFKNRMFPQDTIIGYSQSIYDDQQHCFFVIVNVD